MLRKLVPLPSVFKYNRGPWFKLVLQCIMIDYFEIQMQIIYYQNNRCLYTHYNRAMPSEKVQVVNVVSDCTTSYKHVAIIPDHQHLFALLHV